MSKRATLNCTIKQVDSKILQKTLNHIVEMNDGRLRLIDKNKFCVWSGALSNYGIDVKIVNGQLEVTGEECDVVRIEEVVRQYYVATEFENAFSIPFEKNEQDELVMVMEV